MCGLYSFLCFHDKNTQTEPDCCWNSIGVEFQWKRPLYWACPGILGADQNGYTFKVGQVENVRFQWCNCHYHKALKRKLIIINAGRLDKSMAGSPDGWEVQHGCLLSFRLFAFIWQSRHWRIFTLVLVLMEHPSGISAGLSKTLEMVLGLLRSSLTPSDLAPGSGIPLIMSGPIQAARVWSDSSPNDVQWPGWGVQGHLGRRMRSDPLLLLSRGPLRFGKQFDGACYSSFRGVSHSIFQTPHSHTERSWHVWQSIIVSLFLLWRCGLFISDFTSPSVSCCVWRVQQQQQETKKSWNIRAFRRASPPINRIEQCACHDIKRCWTIKTQAIPNTSSQLKLRYSWNCACKLVLCSTKNSLSHSTAVLYEYNMVVKTSRSAAAAYSVF